MGYRTNTRRIGGGNGFVTPQVVLFGDWVKTSALIHDLPRLIAIGNKKGQKSAANKLKKLVKKFIRAGTPPPGVIWPAFSSDYQRIKKIQGGDGTSFYYRTGLYYRNIKVWSNATGSSYYVGVRKGIRRPKSNITLAKIARILEMGSAVAKIKARPLWKPAYKSFGGGRRIKSVIVWNIRAEIFKTYGVKAKVY